MQRGEMPRLARWFADRILPAALLLLFATVVAGACSRKEELPPPDATYTVRARVVSLPPAGGGEMLLHHEEIPDFRERDGTRSGMKSMTMPFTPAEGLDLSGIAVGDKVRMTFEVRWNARPLLRIVKLEKLPPDTKLELGSMGHSKGHEGHTAP